MAKRGIFKVTPVSTKSVGVTPTRPAVVKGDAALRKAARAGVTRSAARTAR
ncbi:MAG TPA: hypothetical protein VF529_01450 [Solirubrobacteraceae bacterium]|jgi:hypothetical protein